MNLAANAKRAFTRDGVEIFDVNVINDGDFFYISGGEQFMYAGLL